MDCGGRRSALLEQAPFLAHFLARYPEYGQDLPGSPVAALAAFEKILDQIRASATTPDQGRQLRILKNAALLQLCLADLAPGFHIRQIYERLSRLADCCLAAALEGAAGTSPAPPLARQLGIVALGKLGGTELNLASDVDLLFVFPETAGLPPPPAGYPDHQSFFSGLVAQVLSLMGEVTEEGVVWRVDLRLRPDGAAGALATGLSRLANYARERARTWERASLIKARWVTGPATLRRDFYRILGPFIYRRYLDFSVLTEVHQLRREIGRGAGPIEGGKDNLKTGPGGIREIELLTQVWQLVYGGRLIQLQTAQTVPALCTLARQGLMPAAIARRLIRHYYLLRRIEHGLHLAALRANFKIPPPGEEMEALARRCRVRPGEKQTAGQQLTAKLEKTRQEVHQLYQAAFFDLAKEPTAEEKQLARNFFEKEQGPTPLPPQVAGEIEKVWLSLRPEVLLRRAGKGAPAAYRRLWPKLVLALVERPELTAALPRLADFFQASPAKETLFTLLLSRPEVRQALLSLFASSQFLSRILIQQPALIESLALTLRPGPGRSSLPLRQETNRLLEETADLEERMDGVRALVQEELLRTAFQDLSGLIEVEEVGQRISALAEEALRLALLASLDELTATAPERYRLPLKRELERRFAVLAFGRLAGREMGYQSDLDLVFAVDLSSPGSAEAVSQGLLPTSWITLINNNNSLELMEFFVKLSQRIITFLSARTGRGLAFAIDTRLRPSGGQGPLVCSRESFFEYHRRSALWERLALLRCRPVAGGEELCRGLAADIAALVFRPVMGKELAEELLKLRQAQQKELVAPGAGQFNLKFGEGGIFDIRFLAQTLQILCGPADPAVNTANTLQALAYLASVGRLPKDEAAALQECYRFWWRLENWLRLRLDRPADEWPLSELARSVDREGLENRPPLAEVREVSDRVKKIFSSIMQEVIRS